MSKYIYHHYYESKSNIPTSRSTKPGWEKNHEFHQQLINNNNEIYYLLEIPSSKI